MNIAAQVAKRSKDPSSQVGAVIVDQKNRPVSFGFNGFISGCNEEYMSQERPLKYHLVIHAEMNAMTFANRDLTGCKIYSTHIPCANCLKHIFQSGISEVYYCHDSVKSRWSEEEMTAWHLILASMGNSDKREIHIEKISID